MINLADFSWQRGYFADSLVKLDKTLRSAESVIASLYNVYLIYVDNFIRIRCILLDFY